MALQKESRHSDSEMLAGREKGILTHRWFEGINLTDMIKKDQGAP
jgi:hypothetical protein